MEPRADSASGYHAHGRWFADPYLWMERLDDPETQAFVAAQEAITRRLLDAAPGREWMRAELTRAARYARLSAPMVTDAGSYFWQADAGDEKLKLMLERDGTTAVVLDPNAWPEDEVLVFAVPSPDGRFIAMGRATGSTHGAVISLLEVATGATLADRPRGTDHASVAWRKDSASFFYSACPEPGEVPPDEAALWTAIYEHEVGGASRRVFGDDNVKDYWCSVTVSECGRFAVLAKWDFVHANEVVLLRLEDGALLPVTTSMRALLQVQVIGEVLLIHTDLDAPRGRACIASIATPTAWQTLIPEGGDTLQSVTGIGGRIYAVYSRAASHRVIIHAADGTPLREIALPSLGSVNRNEGNGTVSGVSGGWSSDEVWLSFESFTQPRSIYRYDFAADRLTPFHVPEIGLDDCVTEQVWFESADGTKVSMFLVHRRDVTPDGKRAVRLGGYGGFNIALEPRFAPINAAWLKLGGVLAYANVRGGGEYGRAWHAAATKTHRQRSFDDFIAAARWLVSAGWTDAARLAARGNSNGGLLVAAVAMQAPESFGAVFCRAPILDMLRFPNFGHLASATVEYGSPDDPIEGPALAAYSPYHNLRGDRVHPPIAFVAALNDRIAPPHDPLKMVARLQAEGARGGPFLLLPLRASGHAGGTTLSALIEQDVDELSFYCSALGVSPPA